MKQETLEEVAERLFKYYSNNTALSEGDYDYLMDKEDFTGALIEVAKWQEQNSNKKYSEEEVRQMLCQLGNILYNKSLIYEIGEEEPEIYFDDIIEQFKNI